MNGLKLASRYSFNCEGAKRFKARDILFQCALNGSNIKLARIVLEKLETYPYYQQIAKAHGLEIFDIRVISHYWLFQEPNLSDGLHHNFTTLLPIARLPVSAIDVKIARECFVLPARVLRVSHDSIDVETHSIIKSANALKLSHAPINSRVKNPYGLQLARGAIITVHFSDAIELIDEIAFNRLIDATHASLIRFHQKQQKNKTR